MSEIPNALTPEEWANEEHRDGRHPEAVMRLDRAPGRAPYFVLRSHDGWRDEPNTGAWLMFSKHSAALMALANAALPDGDPRKITREGLDALEKCVDEYEGDHVTWGDFDNARPGYYAARAQLAALRALLPPREG